MTEERGACPHPATEAICVPPADPSVAELRPCSATSRMTQRPDGRTHVPMGVAHLEGFCQAGTRLLWFWVFSSTPTTSPHDRQRLLCTASEFSLVAVSTTSPESHQSPIRITAKRRRHSYPWPMIGPRKPLVPTPVHMRRSQISWLPCGSNLFVVQA